MKNFSIKAKRNLRILRTLQGLTQFDLQGKSGVSHSIICMIEKGHREPTAQQMKKISAALGVSEKVIFPLEDK
jgi:transcriptional regulator with XRE-family HTH domain